MNQLMDILMELNSDIDYETCDTLIDDEMFDSYEIDSLVEALNDAFDVNISADDVTPENFNSAESIWDYIQSLS
ncbi:MAG: acyl carrier protein [Lachnospira sp.]